MQNNFTSSRCRSLRHFRVGPCSCKCGSGRPRTQLPGLDFFVLGFLSASSQSAISLSGHGDAVYDIAFSPDGAIMATGSYDKTVGVWRLEEGRQIGSLAGHTDQVFRVAFSPDGKRLASCSGDGSAIVWKTDSWLKEQTLKGHGDPMLDLAFSPDGRLLVTVGSHVQIWEDGEETWSSPHSELYFSVAITPEGNRIACGTRNQIHFFDLKAHALIERRTIGGGMVYQLAYSPDGKWLASASSDGKIRLWDTASGQLSASATADAFALFSLRFSRDGRTLISAGRERVIRTWSVPDLESLSERYGPQETILTAAWSPSGKHLVAGSYDGILHLWKPAKE